MARGALAVAMAALAMALLPMATEAIAAVEFSESDLATEQSAWALYEVWIARHGVSRDSAEKTRRFPIFKKNLQLVRDYHDRDHSYMRAINKFGDISGEEFSAAYVGCDRPPVPDDGGEEQGGFAVSAMDDANLPEAVDWRQTGYDLRPAAVTPIKDQGDCGCCWAFTAAASVEALFSIKRKVLMTLSEQQMVDCDKVDQGCAGGWAGNAFRYIANSATGLAGDASYPYTAREGSCEKPFSPFVKITGMIQVPPFSEIELRAAVAAQPVAVSVGVGDPSDAFKNYHGGIFEGPCSTMGGHAMTLIGYDTESGNDYWILKNSWGEGWGENGYMRLKRIAHEHGTSGTCGILLRPVYPLMQQ